jgi:hypothetical protein
VGSQSTDRQNNKNNDDDNKVSGMAFFTRLDSQNSFWTTPRLPVLAAALETHKDPQVHRSPDWIGLATVNTLIVSGETSKFGEIFRVHTITVIIGYVVQMKLNQVLPGVVYFSSGGH